MEKIENIDLIFKIAGIGIVISVLYTLIKQTGRDEFGYAVLITALVVVLVMVVNIVGDFFEQVRSVFKLY